MHTVILTLISLLVPLITAQIGDDPPVVPPILRPSVWPLPLPSPYYWGDMLNITKCYCEGDNDATAGHYYQFDYRNYHNEQAYRVAWTCEKDATTTGEATVKGKRVSFPVPECWTAQAAWRSKKRKECVKSVYADTFCFELGNSKDPVDHYYFDEEKRGLPNFGIVEYPPDQCVALCRDKVGGKAVASECSFFDCKMSLWGSLPNPEPVSCYLSRS